MTNHNRLLVGTALCLLMAAPGAARAEIGGAAAPEPVEDVSLILAQADDPEEESGATDCPEGTVLEGGECVPVEEEQPAEEPPGEAPEEAPPETQEPEAEPAEEPIDAAPPEEEEAAPVETEESPPAEPEEAPAEPSDPEDVSEPEAEAPAETEPEAEVEPEAEPEMDEPVEADEPAEEPAATEEPVEETEEDAPVEAQEAPEEDSETDECPEGMTMSATEGECVPAGEETTDEQAVDEGAAEEEPAQEEPAEEEPAGVEETGDDEAESPADEEPVEEEEPTGESDEPDEPAADEPVSDQDAEAEEESEPADDATADDGEPVTQDEEEAAEPDEAAPEADTTEEEQPADTEEEQPADAEEVPDSDEEAQADTLNPEQVRQEIREIVEEEGQAIELGQTPEDQRVRRSQIYQRRENARVIEEYNDNRTIVEINNNIYVESPDYDRLVFQDDRVYYEELRGGRVREVIERPDGTRVITIRNRYGDVVRRVRVTPDGREYILSYVPDDRLDAVVRFEDPARDLPPFRLTIPVSEYILEADVVEEPDRYYAFLNQPPVETVQRLYSLEEVQYSERVRDMVRRIDLTTVQFEFGSAQIEEREIAKLEALADAMLRLLDEDPAETFLIEGHTDAVGSELANLALSDRRAESVARALTNVFGVPPENLVTQGYGEQFLKVDTQESEHANRRVAVRRITPLVAPVASR